MLFLVQKAVTLFSPVLFTFHFFSLYFSFPPFCISVRSSGEFLCLVEVGVFFLTNDPTVRLYTPHLFKDTARQ
jgi:hypothetical protein